ncbi:MAG: DEAD/DEAH box helicase family protein, partial [Anaerolineae bacterium]
MEQIWSIIVSFWQTYRDQILVGLIVGLPALIATIWGIIYQRRQWLAERRRDEEERARLEAEAKARAAFPFRRTTPDELPQHLVNFTYKDIPHVPRCAPQRQAELEALVQEKRVLLTGRSGLGKTHEAIHLVRRLAGERPPGRVIVLVPEGRLAEPRELPPDLPTRQNTVVLFLDNLHEEFREAYERPRGEARAGGPDPRTTLQAVLRWFEARCDDFRVVATVREEPGPPGHRGWREWLGYREDGTLWGKFRRYPLPEMEREQALGFIQAMQEWLAAVRGLPLDVDPDAAELMARKFDGTPASLRDFLLIQRETKGRERVTRAIVAQEFDGRFPHDWEREVYNAHIAPYSAPRHLFVALSLLQQAGVTPYWFLAFRLATRMWGIHPSEEERLLGHALMRVETWVKVRDGVLECSEAYLEGRADLAEGARELATVLLAASRKYLPLLAPELIRLGNALWALPRGDRAQNLEEAIGCYQRALEVRTRADFPVEWATTQNNLGN